MDAFHMFEVNKVVNLIQIKLKSLARFLDTLAIFVIQNMNENICQKY